jgi:toxin ParE1/3/4
MSAKPVVPRARAVDDTNEIIDFYLSEGAERAALGFVDALQEAYDHISAYPATGSLRLSFELGLPGLRSWPLKGFSHYVFYVERDDLVDVWRILHGQRDIPKRMREP